MQIVNTYFDQVVLVETNFFQDERGAFLKIFNSDNQLLNSYTVRQINYVESVKKHTLRGLHYQQGEAAESKIFRIMKGSAQIAFANINKDSPTYQQAATIVLNNPKQTIIIPRGFATGYCTLTDNTTILYLSDNDYDINTEAGLLWSDPKFKIDWLTKEPILSTKDKAWPLIT